VTDAVVEVGPGTIRGPYDGDTDLVCVALDSIDDEFALVDEHPVAVSVVWREVLRSVVGEFVETVALVYPTWWSARRIEVVSDAAATTAANVIELHRAEVLTDGMSAAPIVVEIAAEFVVVAQSGSVVAVEPRSCGPETVAEEVANAIGCQGGVLVDTPDEVEGAFVVGAEIADRLRADGVAVSIAHRDRVLAAAAAMFDRRPATAAIETRRPRRAWPGVAVLAGVLLSGAALCAGFVVRPGLNTPAAPDVPMTLLVEGRLAVKVPALWSVQRITAGPGSARVQVVSPDGKTAVHITQSPVPAQQTLAATAATLRRALDEQQPGVFVDFNPADRRADRPAVTYREVRGIHTIRWVVFVDDTVRIGVGCQSAAGRDEFVLYSCDQAIRSAHAIF
jgi:type VII secretion-associated protein (TIGR03931 family)